MTSEQTQRPLRIKGFTAPSKSPPARILAANLFRPPLHHGDLHANHHHGDLRYPTTTPSLHSKLRQTLHRHPTDHPVGTKRRHHHSDQAQTLDTNSPDVDSDAITVLQVAAALLSTFPTFFCCIVVKITLLFGSTTSYLTLCVQNQPPQLP